MKQIQWFPGHMAKARREISEALSRVDAVVELVDARLPEASANPMLRDVIKQKPRVLVMTRRDAADAKKTTEWLSFYHDRNEAVLAVDAKSGAGIDGIVKALENVMAKKRAREAERGIRPRPIRTMVIGIPNVGKSSVINRLAGRAAAKTGDRPGITQTQQWIRVGKVELLDTPGVLWPKFDNEHAAYKLAISGAIKSDILDVMDIASYFVLWCASHYPALLRDRYGLDSLPSDIWTSSDEAWRAAEPVLLEIARKRGLMRQGGVPDEERAASLILREAQTGVLGTMTFEWVDEIHTVR